LPREILRHDPQKFRELVPREGELTFDVSARIALTELRCLFQTHAAL
jgi:hypothetical protein